MVRPAGHGAVDGRGEAHGHHVADGHRSGVQPEASELIAIGQVLQAGAGQRVDIGVVTGALDPADHTDLGPKRTVLSPDPGKVRVRWFAINPRPPGVPDDVMNAMVRERFASFDADHHLTDQTKHPAMHKTASLDVICLLQGEVDLILDKVRTRVKPGQIVIQRGTSHGWEAIGGPALLLAVLIDRPLVSGGH